MEVVKKLKDHVIYKKRSGRFAVKMNCGKTVNGEEKAKILMSEGLVKVDAPKKVEEAVEEQSETEESSEEA